MGRLIGRYVQVFAATAALLFAVLPARAAGPTGKIVGTVTANGQAVPGAKVSVTNENTNEVRTDTSDDSGNFTFPVLPLGNYTVKVEATSFQTYEQKGVVLQVDQNISISAALQVGATTQVVEVFLARSQRLTWSMQPSAMWSINSASSICL